MIGMVIVFCISRLDLVLGLVNGDVVLVCVEVCGFLEELIMVEKEVFRVVLGIECFKMEDDYSGDWVGYIV